jgi:UDP-glucuronate decarboxylase
MFNILVTGSAGFIGTNLCEELLKKGHTVIGIDNYITGSSLNSIYLKNKYKKFNFYECDATNIIDCVFLQEKNINQIYHLASLASPDKYQAFPLETMQVNINGTFNMLKLAEKMNAKFLFTSTSEVYGDPLIHPQPESYYGNVNTVGPRSCYDESKRAGETYVDIFRNKDKDNYSHYKIVRIFNTYGPFMDINDGRIITNFIKQILIDKPLQIYGTGQQTRSFCYISDMVDGLIKMMESQESGPINLGNPYCEFSLLQLKDTFEKVLHKKLTVENLPATKDDPQLRRPDLTMAQTKLNFNPTVTLEVGISETYNYFVNKLKKMTI